MSETNLKLETLPSLLAIVSIIASATAIAYQLGFYTVIGIEFFGVVPLFEHVFATLQIIPISLLLIALVLIYGQKLVSFVGSGKKIREYVC